MLVLDREQVIGFMSFRPHYVFEHADEREGIGVGQCTQTAILRSWRIAVFVILRGLFLMDSLHKPLNFRGESEEQDAEDNGRSSNDPKVRHFCGRRIEFNHLRID